MTAGGRALIIGATGQDGSLTARQLLDGGVEVHVTGRHIDGSSTVAAWQALGMSGQLVRHRLDPLDASAVLTLITNLRPSVIFCLAGQSSVGQSFAIPGETMRSHVDTVINVCSAVIALDLDCHILVAASGEVFGETTVENPATECSAFAPRNPYGVAKMLAVDAARAFRDIFALRLSIAYLYNHESSLRPPNFLFGKILQGIADYQDGNDAPLALGNGDVYRDWGWAPDYAAAMIAMAALPEGHELILATGHTSRLCDAVSAVVASAGLDPKAYLRWNSSEQRRGNEAVTMAADPSKARAVIGWTGSVAFPNLADLLLQPDMNPSCR